jgi:hypothetical protein
MNKKILGFLISLIVFLLILNTGCISDDSKDDEKSKKDQNGNENKTNNQTVQVTVLPVVRITNNNNSERNLSILDYNSIRDNFTKAYNGNYSDELREKIEDIMRNKTIELGEDPEILFNCINATGTYKKSVFSRLYLPFLAEKAKFDDKDVWILAFIWGFQKDDLIHHRFYVIDYKTYEELFYFSCD